MATSELYRKLTESKLRVPSRPRKSEPKWRHIHWEYMAAHQASMDTAFRSVGWNIMFHVLWLPGKESQAVEIEAKCQDMANGSETTSLCTGHLGNTMNSESGLPAAQALAILMEHKPGWVACDLSQNLNRMPVVADASHPFMCITPTSQQCDSWMIFSISANNKEPRPGGHYWVREKQRALLGIAMFCQRLRLQDKISKSV